jgi:hypothetical protein
VEVCTPPATLIIVGASHVAIALYRAMHMTFWLPQAAAALAQVEAGCAPEGTVAKR